MLTELMLGQRVQIESYDPAATSWSRHSGVIKLLAQDRLEVELPSLTALPAGMSTGAMVTLRYIDRAGVHTATTELCAIRIDASCSVVLPAVLQFVVDQRRKFMRVPARVSVSVVIVDSTLPSTIGERDEEAMTEDLSAGGMRFKTSLTLNLGDVLDTRLSVSTARQRRPLVFRLQASVVRLCQEPSSNTKQRVVACQFFFVRETDRSELVRMVQHLERTV